MYPAAVIFDFDGIIVDTEPIHYKAFQHILEPFGLAYSWDEYQEIYMGFDDRDAFRAVFQTANKALNEHELKQLIEHKATIFRQVIAQGTKPYPGVIELINELRQRQVPLAICSGALKSDIKPILEQLDIESYFSHIVTAEDVPQSKPNPASYVFAKELLINSFPDLFSKSERIVAIEDTPAGIASAHGAGLNVIAVTNSYPAIKLKNANKIVNSLTEVLYGNWL